MTERKIPFSLLTLTIFLCAISLHSRADTDFQIIEWTDLIPEADLEALRNPPEYINDIVDGSPEDVISGNTSNSAPPEWESSENTDESGWSTGEDWDDGSTWGTVQWSSPQEEAYQNALTSTKTVEEYNGKEIKLPGFVVPLEFDDDLTITQFFLVPYFGACIHLPPPPPNQMVLVDYPEGFKLEALHTPFWISGELSIQIEQNDLGTSAYAMTMKSFELYDYEG